MNAKQLRQLPRKNLLGQHQIATLDCLEAEMKISGRAAAGEQNEEEEKRPEFRKWKAAQAKLDRVQREIIRRMRG